MPIARRQLNLVTSLPRYWKITVAMGANESKQGTEADYDQINVTEPILNARKNGKQSKLKLPNGKRPWATMSSGLRAHQHPPALARLSIDESSTATTIQNDHSTVSTDPEHHSIELSTLSSRSDNAEDTCTLHVNLDSVTELGSKSSAFQCYRSRGRRRRAYAVDSVYRRRRRSRQEHSKVPSFLSIPSYSSSDTLLARRMWLLGESDRFEKQGNLIDARPYLEECCRLDEGVVVNPFANAFVLHKLGLLCWKMGAYHDSIRVLLRCLAVYDTHTHLSWQMYEYEATASLDEIQGFAVALITLGRVHLSLEELDPAVEYIRKSVDLLKQTIQAQPESAHTLQPIHARALVCMGVVYESRGRLSRAMYTFEKCLKIQRECLGGCHVDVAATLNKIGGIHERCGSYDEAMVCYVEALRLYRSRLGLGCSPLDVAVTLNHAGFIHHQWKQYDRALNTYREALAIFNILLGPCHRNITATKYNIAQAYVAKGFCTRGIHLWKQVLRDQRVSLGDEHPDIAITLEAIATANEELGRLSKACSYHEKALSVRRRRFGSRHLLVARSRDQLGQLHAECGRIDSARFCFREALIAYRFNDLPGSDLRIISTEKRLKHLDRMLGKNNRKPKRFFARELRRKQKPEVLECEEEELVFDYEASENGARRLIL